LALLKPSAPIHFAAGVQVDRQGRVAIVDSGAPTAPTTIDVFAVSKRHSHRLKLLSQAELDDSGVVSSFALTKDGAHLFTAEPHDSLEYAYPQGGSAQAQLSPPTGGNLIEGVAVTPAE
jgi:hypothetical protein